MNDVKVCGRRGLVTFCPACRDWQPFRIEPVHGSVVDVIIHPPMPPEQRAVCWTCNRQLPDVPSYGPEGQLKVEVVEAQEGDGGD